MPGGAIATLRIRFCGGPSHELDLHGGTKTFEIDARPQVQEWDITTAFLRNGPAVLIHELTLEPLLEQSDGDTRLAAQEYPRPAVDHRRHEP